MEQQRAIEEIQEKQENELKNLEVQMKNEEKDDANKALKQFEDERQRLLSEAKNRQAAELTARSDLSAEATQKVKWFIFSDRHNTKQQTKNSKQKIELNIQCD